MVSDVNSLNLHNTIMETYAKFSNNAPIWLTPEKFLTMSYSVKYCCENFASHRKVCKKARGMSLLISKNSVGSFYG